MKNYLVKMSCVVLMVSSIINVYTFINLKNKKENSQEETIVNDVVYGSDLSYNFYLEGAKLEEQEEIVYDNMTLTELGEKLNKVFSSTLSGYGNTVAKLSIESGVDPYLASAIMLHETGCRWTCSNLVRYSNNVGGMRSSGRYMSFATLDSGIEAFINNLKNNYYDKGLTTPELMNPKYAENPNWHQKINYYIDFIKAS